VNRLDSLARAIEVECLIISHSIDYSTDLICYELKQREVKYLRINRDRFNELKIQINVLEDNMLVIFDDEHSYSITPHTLKSVYFRAPVFLRTNKQFSLQEQVYRSQWSSFIRNLIIFENARWINHPVAIYKAENKILQLKKAASFGLRIPQTIVTNYPPSDSEFSFSNIAVKSLDTALFYDNEQELFVYTSAVQRDTLTDGDLRLAPVIIQEFIEPKIDIRATVVGSHIYAVKVLSQDSGIVGDWRRQRKENLTYNFFQLPNDVEEKIFLLMHELDLNFGGVDLIYSNEEYFFVEVNPTGEWGWLTRTAMLHIDKAITDLIMQENAK
jgi:glutathione synthase/RimK-type ligase-like ATP-grasp enzyme